MATTGGEAREKMAATAYFQLHCEDPHTVVAAAAKAISSSQTEALLGRSPTF